MRACEIAHTRRSLNHGSRNFPYARHSPSITMAQEFIKHELNDYKAFEMKVHESSKHMTRFHY